MERRQPNMLRVVLHGGELLGFTSLGAIRRYLLNERAVDKKWIKAAGYWQRGTVGTHEKISEEP